MKSDRRLIVIFFENDPRLPYSLHWHAKIPVSSKSLIASMPVQTVCSFTLTINYWAENEGMVAFPSLTKGILQKAMSLFTKGHSKMIAVLSLQAVHKKFGEHRELCSSNMKMNSLWAYVKGGMRKIMCIFQNNQ